MNEGFALHELLYDESGEPATIASWTSTRPSRRLTGLKRQDVVGRTVSRGACPARSRYWIKRYGEVALTGTPAHFESRSSALGRDYEVFAYRPAPGQFAVIFLDITDRKEAEVSLRASYDLLKIAQRAANAGLWSWDVSAGKLSWSEEFYTLFGLDPMGEASFDAWLGVLHPDDRQQAMESINGSIRERNLPRKRVPHHPPRWTAALDSHVGQDLLR